MNGVLRQAASRGQPGFRTLWLVIVLTALMLVAGCGGGSGQDPAAASTNSSATTTGNVALLLTDAPTDRFDEVNVTINRIELIDADADRVEIFSGQRTVNLLDLQDVSELFSVSGVPVGEYQKIQLGVAAIELVRFDDTSGAIVETVEPKLPSDMIQLNPRGSFKVRQGETLVLEVDVDARKSIHVVEAGNRGMHIFRPVVFVRSIDRIADSKFIRVDGTVDEIDETAQTFRLCGEFEQGNETGDDLRCLLVGVAEATSIFTNTGPASFGEIAAGESATVFGRLRHGEVPQLDARLVYLGDQTALTRLRGTVSSGYDADSGIFEVEVGRSRDFESGTVLGVDLLDGTRIQSRGGEALTAEDITAGAGIWIFGISDAGGERLTALAVFLDRDHETAVKLSGAVGEIDADAGTFMLLPSMAGNISADTLICADDATNLYLISSSTSSRVELGQLPGGASADVYGHRSVDGCFEAETVLAFPDQDNEPVL